VKKVIRGGTVVTASDTIQADVLIDGETIAGVGSFEGVDAEPIDASGCFVLPGLIDNHTHLSMPFGGTWSIDDYDTGTQAAAAGGTTCLVDFALQVHPGGLRSSLEEWQGAGRGHCARRLRLPHGHHQRRRGRDRRHAGDGRGGHLDVQGLPGLQGRPDGHGRPVPGRPRADRRERRAGHGARRERLRHRPPGQEGPGRRQHRPDPPRPHPAEAARGRGHGPGDPARRVRRPARLHRPRHLPRGGRGDHRGPRPRRPGLRRDLPAVPVLRAGRTWPARTSRAPATSAPRRCARRPTRPSCGTRWPTTTCS